MKRSEVLAWLAEHKGQKGDVQIEYKLEDNPRYDSKIAAVQAGDYDQKPKIRAKHVTWKANDGQELEVVDNSTPGEAVDSEGNFTGPYNPNYDPEYDVVTKGAPDDHTDTRSPEVKAEQQALAAEKEWNRANSPDNPDTKSPAYDGSGRGSGRYESHNERTTRENQENTQKRGDAAEERASQAARSQADTDAIRAANDTARVGIEQGRANTEATVATTNAAAATSQAETAAAREAREAKGTTQIVGTPTYADPNITTINPTTGELGEATNPNYDEARKNSENKRLEIQTAIEAGKYSAEVGAQKYKEWYDVNITLPFAQMKEKRDQAAEARAAQELSDKRKAQKAQNDLDRAKLGQDAAESAQANERSLLPYEVGPKFAGEFADATNSLAHGGTLGTDAAAGIHFTPDAFEYKRPDFKSIAKQATKEALKHLTPYNPDEGAPVVANYTGITMPDATTMAGAPVYTPSAAITNTVNSITPYTPPPATPAP